MNLSYSGINTKVKAMGANLIHGDEYRKIASLDSIADFIAFLKNHPGYREIFMRYDEHELHRADVERIFITGFYMDFSKIFRFAGESQRNDLDLVFFRHEITILKNCIRHIYNEKDTYDLSLFQEFFNRHSKIDVAALMSSHTMDEFTRHLKDTPYYPLFSRIQASGSTTPFDYEMQLDIYYFNKSWRLKDKLMKGDNLKAVEKLYGIQIDLLNIMWIYRLKTMYDTNAADILTFTIPVNYKLSKDQLFRLVKSATTDEFLSILKNTQYKAFALFLLNGTMEQNYSKTVMKLYKENKQKYPASMSYVNYYLYRKETEIYRLTTALECIRYGLDPQEKLKYILHEEEPSHHSFPMEAMKRGETID